VRYRPGAGDPQKPAGDRLEGQPAPGDWPACLVANENYANFRAMLVRTDPKCERLVLTAANWMP
jgi:arginine/ornithine N-succinyltransferase beta subunit